MRPVLTGRASLAATILLVALLPLSTGARTLLVVGDLLLVVAVAADLWLGVRPRDLDVRRDVPASVVLREPAIITVTVAYRGAPRRRATVVHLADALPPSFSAPTRRARLLVAAGGRARVRWSLQPARRGSFLLDHIVVRVEGPLGVAAWQQRLEVEDRLDVQPRFDSRRQAELRLTRQRLAEVGLRSAKGRGGGTEFDQLREYTPDDPSTRIDWAATARTGKPIVRTFRAERNQHVVLLVDHSRTMAGRLEGADGVAAPRLEHALDAALAVATVASRLGDRVGLVTFADRVTAVLPPRGGRAQAARCADLLTVTRAELVEADPRGAFVTAIARFRRRALLVVLTDLADAPVREGLLPALPLLLAHHLVLVGGIRDPQVTTWATALPGDASAAYRRASAARALSERDAVAARLRGSGAAVVDDVPWAVAGGLVDAYLEFKAAGRL